MTFYLVITGHFNSVTHLSQTIHIGDFFNLVIQTIDSLTTHLLIAKSQADTGKEKKRLGDTAMVLGDFPVNCSFAVQDEVQSFQ